MSKEQNNETKNNQTIVHITFPVNVYFASGLIVGTVNGVLFHPIDRAFYLRSTEKLSIREPLFSLKYWSHPMQGLRNTFYQRILSHGIYFTLQGEFNAHLYPRLRTEFELGDKSAKFITGATTGAVTGAIANASYAIKYYSFNKGKGGPLENAIEMWQRGGPRPFLKAIRAGMARDIVFGSTYEVINTCGNQYILQNIPKEDKKMYYATSACILFPSAIVSTYLSSPFNHIRNTQFSSAPQKPQPHAFDILCKVWQESNRELKKNPGKISLFARLQFFQKKFMIGPGTIRSAAGTVVGQLLFNKSVEKLKKLDQADKNPESKNRNTL